MLGQNSNTAMSPVKESIVKSKKRGTTQLPFLTPALGLKPFVTVLSKEISEVSVPFAVFILLVGLT